LDIQLSDSFSKKIGLGGVEATTSATVSQADLYYPVPKGAAAMEGESYCSNPTHFTLFSFCMPRSPCTAGIGS